MKQPLLPKLRFPEFRKEPGEWNRLSDIVEFSSGGTPSKDEPSYWNGSIPWISASSMYETKLAKSELNVTELAIGNGTRMARKGSILVLVRGSMLFNRVPMGIAVIDVAFNQDVKALTVNEDVCAEFLLYQMLAVSPRIPINETGIGAGKIDTETLANLNIFLPSLAEQRRIADCLSSLDELIAAEGRKLETLRTYKKGLMQQLFPRAGERVPRLRFPEFRNAGEYREVRLQDVTEECTTRNGDYLSPESVMGVTKLEGIIPMKERLIASDIKRYKLVRKDWFAYNPMRLNIGSIARWPNINDVLVSPDYVVFRCLEEPNSAIDPEYLDQFRRSEQWEDFVTESGDGSVRVRIYYKDIARLELMLPSLAEQRRIADCLSSLDAQIAAQSEKLVALRTHKKGLMQQLFP